MIMILLSILVLALAVWMLQQAPLPAPFIWAGYAICFILAILLFAKTAGISIM